MANPAHQPAPRCPECGTPTAEVAPRAPWWYRRLRLFQAVALLAFLVFLGVKQWQHWPPPPSFSASRPGVSHVEFPSVRFTRADLEAMAAEGSFEGEGDRILQAMAIDLKLMIIDDAELVAAFLAPQADRCEMVRWGWPADVRFIRYDGTFEDVYAWTGVTPHPPRGRTGWMYWRHYQERVHPVKGRELITFNPLNFGASALVVIAAWFLGKALAFFATLAVGRGAARATLRARLRRGLPIATGVLALVAVVVLSLERRVETGLLTPAVIWPPMGATGLTTADLRALLDAPNPDRVVARAILAGAAQAPATGNVLALGWSQPRPVQSGQIHGLWPRGLLDGGLTILAPGEEPFDAPWRPSQWRADWSRATLTIRRDEIGGMERYRRYAINVAALSWPLLGLLAAWLAPALPIRLAMWRRRRRARRRAARGQCARCGYDGVRPACVPGRSGPTSRGPRSPETVQRGTDRG